VPAIRVSVQAPYILNQFSSDRIQVDVAHQFQKIGVFLADDRFIAVLKQLTMTVVPVVK